MPRTKAVILAAGLGTRMKSRTPKVLHPICGRPMLAYVIDAAREATAEKPLVVYSPQTEAIAQDFADEADFALQPTPNGPGDALLAALAALRAATADGVRGDGRALSHATRGDRGHGRATRHRGRRARRRGLAERARGDQRSVGPGRGSDHASVRDPAAADGRGRDL